MAGAHTLLLPGLSLHEGVLSTEQQDQLLRFLDDAVVRGRAGQLRGKSYQAPPEEWRSSGQSRETLQFGVLVKCNKVANAPVEEMPAELHTVLDSLEATGVLSAGQRPDTCCVNCYESGSWIPPHVDSEAFARPFCTVSLRSEQDVVFGDAIGGSCGEWDGGHRFSLPVGSALRVDGAAAGPSCKHALPRATLPRVSLTFRRLSDETRERFEQIQRASAEAAVARQARRVEAKLARGWRPPAPRPGSVRDPTGAVGQESTTDRVVCAASTCGHAS